MKSIVKLFIALFMLFQANSAHAQFGIAPMEKILGAPVGGQVTNSISVTNTQDAPLHITSSIMDWSLTRNGQYEYGEAGTMPDSCATWIQLNPSSFVLAPKQTIEVRYSVTTPANFDREKRAMIFFKSRSIPTKTTTGLSVNISMRVSCKLLIAPNTTTPAESQAKIADMDAASNDGKVKVSITNTGIKSIRVKGSIEARDSDGNLVATGKLLPAIVSVLPELTRDMWAEWDKPLAAGSYTFSAALDYGAKAMLGGQLKAQVGATETVTEQK